MFCAQEKKQARIKGKGIPMQDHVQEKVQKAFNDSIGVILTYLDEAEVGMAIKRAVKAELWALCDKNITPIIDGLGKGTSGKDKKETSFHENNFNR